MKVSDIPYEYICKQKGDNCLCSPEQKKKCPSCKRIVDEEKLIKMETNQPDVRVGLNNGLIAIRYRIFTTYRRGCIVICENC